MKNIVLRRLTNREESTRQEIEDKLGMRIPEFYKALLAGDIQIADSRKRGEDANG